MSRVLSSSLFKNSIVKRKEVEEEQQPTTVCSKKSVVPTVTAPQKVLHSPRRPAHTSPRRLSPKRSPLLQQFYKLGYQNNRYRGGAEEEAETPEEKRQKRTESYKRLSAPRSNK
jgi:hypothetical protein